MANSHAGTCSAHSATVLGHVCSVRVLAGVVGLTTHTRRGYNTVDVIDDPEQAHRGRVRRRVTTIRSATIAWINHSEVCVHRHLPIKNSSFNSEHMSMGTHVLGSNKCVAAATFVSNDDIVIQYKFTGGAVHWTQKTELLEYCKYEY